MTPNADSCWQDLPRDAMANILKKLNLTTRLRMSLVCKSWHAMVLEDDVIAGPEAPWLLLPQEQNSPCLTFYSLSEAKIYELELPLSALGGWCCGSSKGWLAFATGPRYIPQFFLLNPISGARIDLPPLTSIPCFRDFIHRLPRQHNVSSFIQRIEVYDDGSGKCIVAAILSYFEVLALCCPGDSRWIVFKGAREDCFFEDLSFHNGTLYTIMTGKMTGKMSNMTTDHKITLTDCELKLQILTPPYEDMDEGPEEAEVENSQGFFIAKKMVAKLYLVNSIRGELLMIVKYNDVFIMNNRNEGNEGVQNNDNPLKYFRTSDFAVLKVNPNNGKWDWADGLNNQALFVAMSGSMTLPSQSFNMNRGNCVYFAADLEKIFDKHAPALSRESGVYYIGSGKIERSFPSVRLPMQSRMCWFMPTL